MRTKGYRLHVGQRNLKEIGKSEGKILEVRGLPGNSVVATRHLAAREIMAGPGKTSNRRSVGKWDDAPSPEGDRRRHPPFTAIRRRPHPVAPRHSSCHDDRHLRVPVAGKARRLSEADSTIL